MFPIECRTLQTSFKQVLSLVAEKITTKAFVIFSVLFSLIIGFIASCGFLFAGPPAFIASGLCFALLVSVVSFFGCQKLIPYGIQHLMSYVKSIPSLSSSLIDFLKTESKSISSLYPNPGLKECFKGASPKYKKFFFDHPEKLLSAAFTDWTPQIIPSDSGQPRTIILSHSSLPFSLTLSTLDFETLHTYLIKSNALTCRVGYAHQLPSGNPVIREAKEGVLQQHYDTGNETFFISIQESKQLQQEELFKKLFSHYAQIIEHNLSNEILLLEPLKTPLHTPKARTLELLALFCALEQLRYTKVADWRTKKLAPIFPLDYEDFFTLFMKKQHYTLPGNVSNMRILSPVRPVSETALTTIIISGLEEEDKLGLLGQVQPFLFDAEEAHPQRGESILIQNVLDDITQ